MSVSQAPAAMEMERRAFVAALGRREDGAVERLVTEQHPRLLGLARSILRNEADAQDAVQEGLINALRRIETLADPMALESWLGRIVANAALARLRSRRSKRERPIEELLPRFLEDGHRAEPRGWSAETSGARLHSEEVIALVRDRIDDLPASYREVIVLRDLIGMDTAAAAEVLGVTPNLVKVRLHRARQALRTLLEEDLSP